MVLSAATIKAAEASHCTGLCSGSFSQFPFVFLCPIRPLKIQSFIVLKNIKLNWDLSLAAIGLFFLRGSAIFTRLEQCSDEVRLGPFSFNGSVRL